MDVDSRLTEKEILEIAEHLAENHKQGLFLRPGLSSEPRFLPSVSRHLTYDKGKPQFTLNALTPENKSQENRASDVGLLVAAISYARILAARGNREKKYQEGVLLVKVAHHYAQKAGIIDEDAFALHAMAAYRRHANRMESEMKGLR